MSPQSLVSAGQLLVILPAVIFGGVSILTLLIRDPRYRQNPLRQQLWRAGHALSVLSPNATKPNALINLAYVGAVVLTIGLIVLGTGLL